MLITGRVGSTVHVRVAGETSTLPPASNARTSNVFEPGVRLEYSLGEEHAVQEPLSRRHWNVEPGSEETNLKAASAVLVANPVPVDRQLDPGQYQKLL